MTLLPVHQRLANHPAFPQCPRRSAQSYSPTSRGRGKAGSAFTLLELLIVIGLIAVLMVLLAPAMTALKGAGDVTKAASDIAGVLQQARSYAAGNNTYAYVGFYEEDATALIATNTVPPYTGKGRLLVAMVASKDGTTSCEDQNSTTANRIPLTATLINQVGKLVRIDNIHMTDVGAPPSPTPSPLPPAGSLDGRPDFPYTSGSPNLDYQNRINSDDTHSPLNASKWPFVAQGYTFYKTIRFNPRGEANINSSYGVKQFLEIGLKPTHGTAVDTNNKNAAAVQLSGLSGDVKVYQR